MLLSQGAINFLDRCIWPRVLTQSERERSIDEIVEIEYKSGDYVCRKDEIASSWIGVVSGFLRVQDSTKDGNSIMFTGVAGGGWIGEGSLLKMEHRRYEIIATRNARILHLPRSMFLWLLDNNILFNHFIINHLNERLSQFIAMVKYDRLRSPVARVARGISSLFHPLLYPNSDPVLHLSQEELGWMVGVSRQRVNSALGELQDQGLIQFGYSTISIIDFKGLEKIE